MEMISNFIQDYLSKVYIPQMSFTDALEIVIIAFIIYHVMVWIKDTRAWTLLKGILVILAFTMVAILFNMETILWLAGKTLNVGIIAIVVIFQPELRKALEQLGQQKLIKSIIPIDDSKKDNERFSDTTVNELVRATYELAKVKTGALMVIEQDFNLSDYIKTGISVDAVISSQLLINIFEHNTPLHDGAVIIRGNRIVSATCYLPLSDNMRLSKELGTRHRAGVGVSEVTDSLTIIVSEETGKVSIAFGGELIRNVDQEYLRKKLVYLQNKSIDAKSFRIWKGKMKNEKKEAK